MHKFEWINQYRRSTLARRIKITVVDQKPIWSNKLVGLNQEIRQQKTRSVDSMNTREIKISAHQ